MADDGLESSSDLCQESLPAEKESLSNISALPGLLMI